MDVGGGIVPMQLTETKHGRARDWRQPHPAAGDMPVFGSAPCQRTQAVQGSKPSPAGINSVDPKAPWFNTLAFQGEVRMLPDVHRTGHKRSRCRRTPKRDRTRRRHVPQFHRMGGRGRLGTRRTSWSGHRIDYLQQTTRIRDSRGAAGVASRLGRHTWGRNQRRDSGGLYGAPRGGCSIGAT